MSDYDDSSEGPVFVDAPVEDHLKGYIASAITRLSGEEEDFLRLVSIEIKRVASEWAIDVHEPIKESNPREGPGVRMSDREVHWLDRKKVSCADVVFEVCDHPSHGVGWEDSISAAACVPVIRITRSGKISKMLTGGPTLCLGTIELSRVDELEPKLRALLNDKIGIIRNLRGRRDEAGDLGVAAKMRHLRCRRRASEKDSAEEIGVDESFIEKLETEPENVSNPSLVQLKMMCSAAGIPVEDILSVSRQAEPPIDANVAKSLLNLEVYALEPKNNVSYLEFRILKRNYASEQARSQALEGAVAARSKKAILEVHDWAERHKRLKGGKPASGGAQPDLFGNA